MQGDFADLDVLFEETGGFGTYQIILCISLQWAAMFMCTVSTVVFALGGIPPAINCTDDWAANVTFHKTCDAKENCTDWTTSPIFQFNGYVEEFGLFCEREYISRLIQSVQNGLTVAYAVILGHTIDHFGRKWPIIIVQTMTVIFVFIGGFSTGWPMLLVCFIGTVVSEGLTYSYFSELVTKKYRSVIAVATQWCVVYPVNTLIAYLTGNWRHYMITIGCICFPLMIIYIFFLVDSPRWLIQHGKYQKAVNSLRWIAKVNRVPESNLKNITPERMKEYSSRMERNKIPYNYVHLFTSKALALRTVLQFSHNFVYRIALTVIFFNLQKLAGSPFLNVALIGILRLWVPFFVVWMDWKAPKFGRKWLLLCSLALITVCYTGNTIIFWTEKHESLKILVTVLSQIIILTLVSVYILTVQMLNVELFPTVLRSVAYSVSFVSSAIGGIIGPQILLLDHVWEPFPYLLVTILCIIMFVVDVVLLPETHGKPLIESMEQAKSLKIFDNQVFPMSLIARANNGAVPCQAEGGRHYTTA